MAGIGSWEWDISSNTVTWSDEMFRIYGLEPGEFGASYDAFLILVHPDDRGAVEDAVHHSYATGEPFVVEHRVVRADGRPCILQSRGEVVFDGEGNVVCMAGTGQDVTDARLAALELAEAKRQLTEAQRLGRLGSWRYDIATGTSEWSDVMYELYGYDRSDYRPQLESFLSRVHPDDAQHVREMLQRAIDTGLGWEGDIRVMWPNGEERILYGRSEVEVDERGRRAFVRGTRQDVTEMRHDEARLRAAEEQFRLAFENAAIGMAVVSTDGHWLRVNQALCDIVGYSADDLRQLTFQDITHPDDLDADLGFVEQMLRGEIGDFQMDKRYFHADGHIVWVQLNCSVVRDENGAPMHFISQIQDVTARREAEERLRESEHRALLASKTKSQFLANMSHEIRTPLNGVIGMAELLADSPLSDAQRGHVDGMRSAANSLLAIINDILDLSKIEAGKLDLDCADFSLSGVINETIALFAMTAATKGIELRHESCDDYDAVRGDAVRVRQVLANLIGNGVKFTERGEVVIRSGRGVDGRVRFEVHDTGVGIPFDAQERLMTPFEQGDASTTRRFGGTGLGLAICRDLVALMNGDLGFTSAPGEGSTFVVTLPLEPAHGDPSAAAPVVAAVTRAPHAGGREVLLAEDNAVNQFVARAMLERLGWHVTVVDDGQKAIDALRADDFDLVILDCQMPVLDGYGAARAIRSMAGPKAKIPILAMTANALAEDRQRCLDAGMDEYVAKPITKELIASALDRVLCEAS